MISVSEANEPEIPLDSPDGSSVSEETKPPFLQTVVARIPFRMLTIAVLLAIAAGVMPAMWSKWHGYRTGQYKEACIKARDEKAWGRLDTASRMWLDWDESSDDAKVFQAEARLQAGDLEEAVSLLDTVSPTYKACLQAYAFQAEILFSDLNRPMDAEKVWTRMLAIDPNADIARKQLVYLYSMTLQFDKLTKLLREGIELGREPPESYAYLFLSRSLNFTDGIVVVEKWLKAAPDNEILQVALAYYFAKNQTSGDGGIFEKSDVVPGDLKPMNDCLQKYPGNLNVLAFHMEKRSFDGNVKGTEEILRMAPPESENDPRFWKFRAWVLRMKGNQKSARESIEKAIAMDPFDWRARWEQASILRLLGEREAAEKAAEVAAAGKAAERMIMELPNAQMLTWGNVETLYRYARMLNEQMVMEGLLRRMPPELAAELTANSDAPASSLN